MSQVLLRSTNLLVKVFPVVLSHESEKSQEGPAEGVEAGVAIVRITASFDTYETLWTGPANTHRYTLNTTFVLSKVTPGIIMCKEISI